MLDQFELNQRYSQYQREVAQEQLCREIRANRTGLFHEVWAGLGALLITPRKRLITGNRAQTRWQNS